MAKSTLFGDVDLEMIDRRLKGDKSDPSGHYSRLTYPKIEELVNVWFPQIEKFKKLLNKRKYVKKE